MGLKMWSLGVGLLALLASSAQALEAANLAMPKGLTEVFTSTNCPNCPAAEKYLGNWAASHPDMLVVFSHVDYWDEHALKPDPRSLAEATQRQYDYSNVLGRRPGEVFTPQPIIDGGTMIKPPFHFTWPDSADSALTSPLPQLAVAKSGDGYNVTLPSTYLDGKHMLMVMGIEPDEKMPVWHMQGLAQVDLTKTATVELSKGLLPKGQRLLVLVQGIGPGKIEALGIAPL